MTIIRRATLAFITEPEPGVYLLNLQFEGEPGISRGVPTLERVQISETHLALFNADCARLVAGLVGRMAQ